MINWFRHKLHNFIFPQDTNELVESKTQRGRALISRRSQLDSRGGLNFTIHMANGGYVLEYSTYNDKTDRHDNALHIINSDTDLGQGIAHIITLECLRR
jgi:hypothetical protein